MSECVIMCVCVCACHDENIRVSEFPMFFGKTLDFSINDKKSTALPV